VLPQGRRIGLIIGASALVSALYLPTLGAPPGQAAAPPPTRQLIAEDDFDGSSLNTANWVPYDENSSNEVSHWSPSELTVGDGELRVHSHGKDPTGVNNYSGALSWSLGVGNQTYGMWAVRARFDPGAGYGPAILLWPQSNNWPHDGEIDLVESVQPSRDTALSSLHWGDTAPGYRESGKQYGDFSKWHVYTVDWQPTYVSMAIDGTVVYDTRQSTRQPVIPSTPMHLVIQQEPGPFGGANWIVAPNSSTPNDVTVHVDWVKIYR
jgi:beta-glucanase (GH16 family)